MRNIFLFFIFIWKISYLKSYENNYKVTLTDYLSEKNIGFYKLSEKNYSFQEIKNIVILCPLAITGGPENLCQIYLALKKIGFNVYMYWLAENDYCKVTKQYRNGSWYLLKKEQNDTPECYKKNYDVKDLEEDIILDNTTLIMVPGFFQNFLGFFEKSLKSIAWLAIKHMYLTPYSSICYPLIDQRRLGDLDCIHFSQAPWISKILYNWGAESIFIGDYISQVFITEPLSFKLEDTIAFAPRRGRELAMKFVTLNVDLDYIYLQNMNQEQMVSALDKAKIYIDFGDFPGKDRIPREAMARNCVVFIHNQGCAVDYDSFPIDNYFRFSEQDVFDGTLYQKIKEVLNNYENMLKKQIFMRDQVFQEYELFEKRMKNVFVKV